MPRNKRVTAVVESDPLAEYEAIKPVFERFKDRMKDLVKDLLQANNISVFSITGRVKEPDSLAAKFALAEKDYRGLEDVTDLCGVRVITFYADDVDRVAKMIRAEFQVDPSNSVDKRLPISPDRFGYSSLHYIAGLRPKHSRLTENHGFRGMNCEIQIRSLLQHAWAEIEHDLGYKSKTRVPDEIRRRFSRLAGLFELSDDEFVGIRRDVLLHRREVENFVRKFPENAEINDESLRAFAKFDSIIQALDREAAVIVGARLEANRLWGDTAARVLRHFGLKTIRDLRLALQRHQVVFRRFTRLFCSSFRATQLPAGISLAYFGHYLSTEKKSLKHAQNYMKRYWYTGPGATARNSAQRLLKCRRDAERLGVGPHAL